MKQSHFIALIFYVIVTITGCCKEKSNCKSGDIEILPFVERIVHFCNDNSEYIHIFDSKSQIDSLEPLCSLSPPLSFPIDESNMKYILVGRLSYHLKDTFQTIILRDSCLKLLKYEVNMIQRDTTVNCCPYGTGAVMTMFCSVENIPADYEVEVKYKYVPLGE